MQERPSKMFMKCARIIVVALFVSLVITTAARALFFANICLVTGTIQYHGQSAEKGLPIVAFIGEDKVSESQTLDNGAFELRIPEYDSSKPDIKGYRSPNDVILVKLDGRTARPTFSPSNENIKVDLRVESTLDVKLSTWGKIKALFK
jgi:hypothetical protein